MSDVRLMPQEGRWVTEKQILLSFSLYLRNNANLFRVGHECVCEYVYVVSDVTTTITHAMIFCVCVAYLGQTGALSCRSSVDHSVFAS